MNSGSKVQVVGGRNRKALENYTGTVDVVVRGSGKVCVTFVNGVGDEQQRASLMFLPGELREINLSR